VVKALTLLGIPFSLTHHRLIGQSGDKRRNHAMEVVDRFKRISLDDGWIGRIEIDVARQECSFWLDVALLLKDAPEASIFDPQERYEPARLTFKGVRCISCPEGNYCLNVTIIGSELVPLEDGLVQFRLTMTGGHSNETFMRSLVIEARDFSLGGAAP
jgi:hypothetical protein